MRVFIERCPHYNESAITSVVERWRSLFASKVTPGDRVVLKPNWIAAAHKYNPHEWQSVITHPVVVTCVLKIVLELLNGRGEVTITDGPQTDTSWAALMERMDQERWERMGRDAGVAVRVVDLREDEWEGAGDVVISRRRLPGDPMGSVVFDLGTESEFAGHTVSGRGYYGADYDKDETNWAHSSGRHMYKVSRSVIDADVFVNLPKLKTHKKAGITCSLKNVVGINTYKNWLPHHNEGTPAEGGDQFPADSIKNRSETILLESFKRILARYPRLSRLGAGGKALGRAIYGDTKRTIRSGNWHGNDTLWRMVLDLNRILAYGDNSGRLRQTDARRWKKYLSIVDGVVAGQGSGPEAPSPIRTGVLVAGTHPVSVDALCATIMGFDWQKIPCIRNAFRVTRYPLCDFVANDLAIESSEMALSGRLSDLVGNLDAHGFRPFQPHFGWTGHIEHDAFTVNTALGAGPPADR